MNDTVAQNPNDLLEGISDMFVNAQLSCNFAKKNQKIDWTILSSSILNKLHPGNAIFRQQINKLKQEKENYQEQQMKNEKKRRRRGRNSRFLSSNLIPSQSNDQNGSRRSIHPGEPRNELESELLKISEQEAQNSLYLHSMATQAKSVSRPVGGKNYQHVKPKYKNAVNKTKLFNFKSEGACRRNKLAKRMRPSSA